MQDGQLVLLTFTDGASPVHWMPAFCLLSVVLNITFDPIGGVAVVAGNAICAFPVPVATTALAVARPVIYYDVKLICLFGGLLAKLHFNPSFSSFLVNFEVKN